MAVTPLPPAAARPSARPVVEAERPDLAAGTHAALPESTALQATAARGRVRGAPLAQDPQALLAKSPRWFEFAQTRFAPQLKGATVFWGETLNGMKLSLPSRFVMRALLGPGVASFGVWASQHIPAVFSGDAAVSLFERFQQVTGLYGYEASPGYNSAATDAEKLLFAALVFTKFIASVSHDISVHLGEKHGVTRRQTQALGLAASAAVLIAANSILLSSPAWAHFIPEDDLLYHTVFFGTLVAGIGGDLMRLGLNHENYLNRLAATIRTLALNYAPQNATEHVTRDLSLLEVELMVLKNKPDELKKVASKLTEQIAALDKLEVETAANALGTGMDMSASVAEIGASLADLKDKRMDVLTRGVRAFQKLAIDATALICRMQQVLGETVEFPLEQFADPELNAYAVRARLDFERERTRRTLSEVDDAMALAAELHTRFEAFNASLAMAERTIDELSNVGVG